jgi:hypothetical protein
MKKSGQLKQVIFDLSNSVQSWHRGRAFLDKVPKPSQYLNALVPGNTLVMETDDPHEFMGLFSALKTIRSGNELC